MTGKLKIVISSDHVGLDLRKTVAAHLSALGHTVEHLKTGDLAQRTGDGLFRIVGRLKRFSKIAGLRIAHDAVEAALSERLAKVRIGDPRDPATKRVR